jgi:hypothetical protein
MGLWNATTRISGVTKMVEENSELYPPSINPRNSNALPFFIDRSNWRDALQWRRAILGGTQ